VSLWTAASGAKAESAWRANEPTRYIVSGVLKKNDQSENIIKLYHGAYKSALLKRRDLQMVKDLQIYPPNTLILDSVTFLVDFNQVTVEPGHNMGPVFAYGAARAVLTEQDASRLVAAGVKDNRRP